MTATHNGNWGIYDNSALGNTYMGCHSERNGTGAYITGLAGGSDVNRNLFIGCTGEGHVLVENPSQWIGGSSEQVPYYFPSGVWKNEASTLQQGGIFPLYRQVVRFRNSTGIVADPEAGVNQGLMELGATVCSKEKPICSLCPWRGRCVALKTDQIAFLPLKKPQKEKSLWLYNPDIVQNKTQILFTKTLAIPVLSRMWMIPGDIQKITKKPTKYVFTVIL